MKITELIDELVKAKEKHGDVVVACCDLEGYLREVNNVEIWASTTGFDGVKSGDLYISMRASNNPPSE